MSIQLVIAEKPSVARSIAGVIGADQKRDGYSYRIFRVPNSTSIRPAQRRIWERQ